MITEKAFLIGNGINLLYQDSTMSWGDLLNAVSNKFSNISLLKNEHIPFPLKFEEILFLDAGEEEFNYDLKVKKAKETIAEELKNIMPNNFHEKIIKSKLVNNILTTNYDYCFEKVLQKGFNNEKRLPNATLETKHSIKRKNEIVFDDTKKTIWHVHGEINHNQKFKINQYPSLSIQIGYEHYGEYLTEIKSFVNGRKYSGNKSIIKRLDKGIEEPISWIDILFTKYVIILGISLDFSEIDIWWLLNYRRRIFSKYKKLKENTIIFYYPSLPNNYSENVEENVKNNLIYLKNSAIAQMLKTLGVKAEQILCDNYEEFYSIVLENEKIY